MGSCEGCESCEPSRSAKNKSRNMTCDELGKKIKELIDTEKRGRCGLKGLMQRFRDYLGDDSTHGPQFINQQRALNTYAEEFIKKGCGPPPPGAREWGHKQLPAPASDTIGNVAKATVATGAAIGLGYGVYRVIRFLPSLFPALWPTIPANLAIP